MWNIHKKFPCCYGEKMKKILLTGLAAAMMIFANIGISQATLITITKGDTIQLTHYNSVDNAGVMTFNVFNPDGSLIGSLDTFCIQENVYIDKRQGNTIKSLTKYVGGIDNCSDLQS